ncbi:hydrogenase nickel incorporation protein HypB [Candidatus Bathyarchaeota archaeon]|nr:hydrogenase nickel incorporation protein HypB [Candidatus Bathyarchaeota archaeon]
MFDIELDENLLKANEEIANENMELLKKHNVLAIDVMGATGSGKTSLIEKLVESLKGKYTIAAFKGDLTTTIDAERIKKHGVVVVPISTGKECHLDANLVRKALQRIDLEKIDLLFIENVGNLICPSDFPLGSEKRIVVISVTEGPYMVIKHPFIFADADVAVINKKDLAQPMNVSIKKLEQDIYEINPNVKVVATNCRSGENVSQVIQALNL